MKQWGKASGGWPSEKPLGFIGAVVLGVIVAAAAGWWHYAYRWTELQREYRWSYLKTQFALVSQTSHALVFRVEGKNKRLAVNADLMDPAVIEGRVKLLRAGRPQPYDNAKLREWLRAEIYGGRSPWTKLLGEAQWPGAIALLLGLVRWIPKDRERARIRRDGRRLRGPELVTAREFNRRHRAKAGMCIAGGEHTFWSGLRSYVLRLFLRRKSLHPLLRIPYEQEPMHFMLMGDTGAGKGALVRQILLQIAERGETAIVYDPALEYLPRFYRPERGDLILNPLDQRMPYWSPSDEVGHPAEAATVAASLFPDEERGERNLFFAKGARRVFAHLLSFRPTPQELIQWLCNVEEIDRRVKGTELASLVYQGAEGQRGGMLGSLAMVGEALKLLPTREETSVTWSARQWAQARKGWLFLSSRPSYREALEPVLSLWLDLLVVRLMGQPAAAGRRVWFVLDELATLQKLPQLHTAVTENRKSGNPVVLSFQGRSQIEKRYGRDAEAIFSQPATKVFLPTSEAEAARWISAMIGEVEIERLGESRSSGEFPQRRRTHGRQLERRTEPLVMASQIAGLENLHGYLKSGNLVVPLVIDYLGNESLPPAQEAFLERPLKVPPSSAAPAAEPVFFK
jgi:Type IV secretion-system coupling protein DNA-binding domain